MSENDNTPVVNLTAYTASKVANKVFELSGFDYAIKPQAMYSLRKTIGVDEDGKLIAANFKTWLDKKLEQLKNGEVTSERGDYEELAKQFMSNNEVDEDSQDALRVDASTLADATE
jgi:hypothetical protein